MTSPGQDIQVMSFYVMEKPQKIYSLLQAVLFSLLGANSLWHIKAV